MSMLRKNEYKELLTDWLLLGEPMKYDDLTPVTYSSSTAADKREEQARDLLQSEDDMQQNSIEHVDKKGTFLSTYLFDGQR